MSRAIAAESAPNEWVGRLARPIRHGISQISVLPPSLKLLRKVETELATIERLHDETTVRRRVAALNVEIAKVNSTVVEGPPTRRNPLNVDQVVVKW